MTPTTANLWHGYSLDDLHQATLEALRADRWLTSRDFDERYAAAWHAIAERLCISEGSAAHRELLDAGVMASHAVVRQADQSHGRTRYGARGPNFGRYWDAVAARSQPNQEDVLTLRALVQIVNALTGPQREALNAYVETGDKQAAAERLGLSPTGYSKRLRQARKAAQELWFEHETAPQLARNRRPGARNGRWKGRARLTESQVDELRARYHAGGVTYADLAAEVGANPDRLAQLIRGTRLAVPDETAA